MDVRCCMCVVPDTLLPPVHHTHGYTYTDASQCTLPVHSDYAIFLRRGEAGTCDAPVDAVSLVLKENRIYNAKDFTRYVIINQEESESTTKVSILSNVDRQCSFIAV